MGHFDEYCRATQVPLKRGFKTVIVAIYGWYYYVDDGGYGFRNWRSLVKGEEAYAKEMYGEEILECSSFEDALIFLENRGDDIENVFRLGSVFYEYPRFEFHVGYYNDYGWITQNEDGFGEESETRPDTFQSYHTAEEAKTHPVLLYFSEPVWQFLSGSKEYGMNELATIQKICDNANVDIFPAKYPKVGQQDSSFYLANAEKLWQAKIVGLQAYMEWDNDVMEVSYMDLDDVEDYYEFMVNNYPVTSFLSGIT